MTETLALLVFLFPLAYSPGPGNMVFAANAARFGIGATITATLGYHVATWVVTLAIGAGIGAAAGMSPPLMATIRWAGAAYVLWLAWTFLQAGRVRRTMAARPMGAGGGAALLLLNPKAYVIIALMFSQFAAAPVIWVTTVFTLNNLLAFTLWSLLGDRLLVRARSAPAANVMNTVFAVALAGVALWMALR